MARRDVRDMMEFVDNEATSIVQALRSIAQKNDDDAHRLAQHYGQKSAPALLLAESAEAWRRKADQFDAIFDRITQEDLDALR